MASIVTKLLGIYQECRELHLDVKLSLEIRDGQEYFTFSRTPKPSMTVSAGTPRTARKKSSTRDTQRREEWWERRRRQLETQAAPSSRSYSDAVRRNKPPETLILRQEPNNGNPVLSRVQNNPSKPDTEPLLSTVLEPKPLLAPNPQPKPSPGENPPPVPLPLHHGIQPSQMNPAPTPETGDVSIEDFRRLATEIFSNIGQEVREYSGPPVQRSTQP